MSTSTFKALKPYQIVRQLAGISTTGLRLECMLSHVAKSAIVHCQHHNDVKYLNDLVSAMPKSSKTQGMVNYIKEFAPVSYHKESGFKYAKNSKKRKDKEFKSGDSLFDMMVNSEWVDFKKETIRKEKTEDEKVKAKSDSFVKWFKELPADKQAELLATLQA